MNHKHKKDKNKRNDKGQNQDLIGKRIKRNTKSINDITQVILNDLNK